MRVNSANTPVSSLRQTLSAQDGRPRRRAHRTTPRRTRNTRKRPGEVAPRRYAAGAPGRAEGGRKCVRWPGRVGPGGAYAPTVSGLPARPGMALA